MKTPSSTQARSRSRPISARSPPARSRADLGAISPTEIASSADLGETSPSPTAVYARGSSAEVRSGGPPPTLYLCSRGASAGAPAARLPTGATKGDDESGGKYGQLGDAETALDVLQAGEIRSEIPSDSMRDSLRDSNEPATFQLQDQLIKGLYS